MNRRALSLAGFGVIVLVLVGGSFWLFGLMDDTKRGPLRLEFERPVEGPVNTDYYTLLNRSEMEQEIPMLVELLDQAKAEQRVAVPEHSEDAIVQYLQEQAGPSRDWREIVFEGNYYDFERHIQ